MIKMYCKKKKLLGIQFSWGFSNMVGRKRNMYRAECPRIQRRELSGVIKVEVAHMLNAVT